VDDHPHRLSNQPVAPLEAARLPLFRELLDLKRSRRGFAEDGVVGALVPPSLRQDAMDWFRWQGVMNRRLVPGLGPPAGQEALHAVLTRTSLETLPLWMLGSTQEEQRIARALDPRRARQPDVQGVLGRGALAERRYEAAARHFRLARNGRSAPRLARLEILALCLADQMQEASRLARRVARETHGTPGYDAHWRWLEATFGLPDPRRS